MQMLKSRLHLKRMNLITILAQCHGVALMVRRRASHTIVKPNSSQEVNLATLIYNI
jgi:hypothetical protein